MAPPSHRPPAERPSAAMPAALSPVKSFVISRPYIYSFFPGCGRPTATVRLSHAHEPATVKHRGVGLGESQNIVFYYYGAFLLLATERLLEGLEGGEGRAGRQLGREGSR